MVLVRRPTGGHPCGSLAEGHQEGQAQRLALLEEVHDEQVRVLLLDEGIASAQVGERDDLEALVLQDVLNEVPVDGLVNPGPRSGVRPSRMGSPFALCTAGRPRPQAERWRLKGAAALAPRPLEGQQLHGC